MSYRYLTKIPLSSILFWVVLVLLGCRTEEITSIYEEDIEDPNLIGNPVAKGTISYAGTSLAGVKVEIHQQGQLMGAVETDQNGKFNTQSINLIPNKDITLYCKKEGYTSTPYRFIGLSTENLNILLLPITETNYHPNEIIDPSSPNLIILKGKVVNGFGLGIVAKGVAIYNVTAGGGGDYNYEGAVFETNNDGSFEILVPKGQELFYQIKQEGCSSQILTKSTAKLFDESPAEIIGPFSENSTLPTINSNLDLLTNRVLKLSMKPYICQGFLFVKNGSVNWQVSVGSQTINVTTQLTGQDVNESFEFCLSESDKNLPTLISYTVYDFDNKTTASLSNIQTTDLVIDLGVVRPCDPIGFNFELTIDGIFYQSDIANFADQINAAIVNGNLIVPFLYSNSENRWIRFIVPNITQPNTLIKDFRYLGNNGYYYQKNQEIKCSVDIISNNVVSGTIDGKIEDENNGNKVVEIKGKFNFKYQ